MTRQINMFEGTGALQCPQSREVTAMPEGNHWHEASSYVDWEDTPHIGLAIFDPSLLRTVTDVSGGNDFQHDAVTNQVLQIPKQTCQDSATDCRNSTETYKTSKTNCKTMTETCKTSKANDSKE